MFVCRTSKINMRTGVIARASFGVLKAGTVFNRTHLPDEYKIMRSYHYSTWLSNTTVTCQLKGS